MKRTQKIVSKKASGEGIMGGVLLLGLATILFIALLGLVSTPALANDHGWHFKHSRHKHHLQPRACSETASAVFIACQNGNEDDYWIAKANCYNSPKEDQAETGSKRGSRSAAEQAHSQTVAWSGLEDSILPIQPRRRPDLWSVTKAPANWVRGPLGHSKAG